jgi:hypothetical protein
MIFNKTYHYALGYTNLQSHLSIKKIQSIITFSFFVLSIMFISIIFVKNDMHVHNT